MRFKDLLKCYGADELPPHFVVICGSNIILPPYDKKWLRRKVRHVDMFIHRIVLKSRRWER